MWLQDPCSLRIFFECILANSLSIHRANPHREDKYLERVLWHQDKHFSWMPGLLFAQSILDCLKSLLLMVFFLEQLIPFLCLFVHYRWTMVFMKFSKVKHPIFAAVSVWFNFVLSSFILQWLPLQWFLFLWFDPLVCWHWRSIWIKWFDIRFIDISKHLLLHPYSKNVTTQLYCFFHCNTYANNFSILSKSTPISPSPSNQKK